MKGKTPVALLTGFLGSGKTTLLSQILAQGGFKDTAVIVNEFGEISIDHLVVADLAENILELRDGCLRCTIRGDLVMILRDLNRRQAVIRALAVSARGARRGARPLDGRGSCITTMVHVTGRTSYATVAR